MAEVLRLRIPPNLANDSPKEPENNDTADVNPTGYIAGGNLDFNKRPRPKYVKREKSMCTAYLLWLLGGIFGLHLIYLRRDRQAFVWLCTVGGYLGVGALRDFVRIPEYVREVNQDESYEKALKEKMKKKKKPPLSLVRFVGQILVGNSWSFLFASAIPEEEIFGMSMSPLIYLAPLGSALAVWTIGNIGRQTGGLKWATIGAYLPLPFSLMYPGVANFSVVTSAVLFNWRDKQWRSTPDPKKHICRRLMTLLVCGLLFSSLWFSFFYFNATVTDKHGEKIKLRDAAKNFLNSPMFLEFKKNLGKVFEDAREKGWSNGWTSFIELLDPHGEKHSLKVLGLEKGATQEEITATYRRLAREWHPDKHEDSKKEEANARFIKIKEAYEKLSIMKKQRNRKNKQSEEL